MIPFELKMYATSNEHSKIYGFDSKNPLFIENLVVSKELRQKGIGNKLFKLIIDYAIKNNHDLIFGHIPQNAEPSIEIIKYILLKSGYNLCDGNNDFYKKI